MITTITDKNIGNIYGKLMRFFKDSEVTYYHNFDCGWKNIQPYYEVDEDSVDVQWIEYPQLNSRAIGLKFNRFGSYLLNVGDRVAFYGSKIILQMQWTNTHDEHYLYAIFSKTTPLIKRCCNNCIHNGWFTTDDVACCNCCEDHEFYEEA